MYRFRRVYLARAGGVCRAWHHEAQSELVSILRVSNDDEFDGLVDTLSGTDQLRTPQRLCVSLAGRFELGDDQYDDARARASTLLELCPQIAKVELAGADSWAGLDNASRLGSRALILTRSLPANTPVLQSRVRRSHSPSAVSRTPSTFPPPWIFSPSSTASSTR